MDYLYIKGEIMANTIKIRDNVPRRKDIDSAINNSIKWLAAEFEYEKRIFKDFNDLKAALSHGDEKRALGALNQERRDSRYLGRCQRRVTRFDNKVTQLLDKLKRSVRDQGVLSKIGRFESDLKVENGHLIEIASMFLGKLKGDIDNLRKAINNHNGGQVKALLIHMEGLILSIQKWLSAEVADLQELERVA